jgi:hypothetical protein
MMAKIWQADSIRNHLLTVRTGMHISLPASFVLDGNGQLAAYREGCNAAITYMAENFGLNLDDAQPVKKPQTRELRLWSREDIKRDLEVAWKVMRAGQPLLLDQNPQLIAYYRGINNTLLGLAQSFDLEGFVLPDGNSSI